MYPNWKNLPGNRFLIPTPAHAADAVRTVARLIFPANICLPRSWFRILRPIGWKKLRLRQLKLIVPAAEGAEAAAPPAEAAEGAAPEKALVGEVIEHA